MRYLIGSQLDLVAVPLIVMVGIAYIWVVDRLLGAKAADIEQAETASMTKAA